MSKMKGNSDIFKFVLVQLEKMDKGTLSSEDANAVTGLLRQANNNLSYELNRAKTEIRLIEFNKKNGTDVKIRNIESDE